MTNFAKALLVVALWSVSLYLAAPSKAFTDTFSFDATGPGANLSGTLTATPTGTPGQELVTGIAGEFNGAPLEGLIPGGPGVTTTPDNLWSFDNLLYTSGPSLDEYGLGFYLDGGIEANLVYFSGYGYALEYGNSAATTNFVPIDKFSLQATPEPSSMVLLATGVLALVGRTFRDSFVK